MLRLYLSSLQRRQQHRNKANQFVTGTEGVQSGEQQEDMCEKGPADDPNPQGYDGFTSP